MAEDLPCTQKCIRKAIQRIDEIRNLPEKQFLETLDGQFVDLDYFFCCCLKNWPHCCLFSKFYYWKNEVIKTVSVSSEGFKQHKIKIYTNCLSTFCKDKLDPGKTHGDVAEFYDEHGVFMGIAVYMGMGKYCSIPHSEYLKESNDQSP
jgi:hypothetical protein